MSIGTQHDVSKDSTTAPQGGWLPRPARVLPPLLVGLALRIFLVLRFPADTPDAQLYQEIARNWLTLHVYGYGLTSLGVPMPTDIRMPGYPAFLALICLLVGCGRIAILWAQVVFDLGTCLLAAWLAARLVSIRQRPRVALATLWLAAACPFVANYAAAALTEVLATFLTTAAWLPSQSDALVSVTRKPRPQKRSVRFPGFRGHSWLGSARSSGPKRL